MSLKIGLKYILVLLIFYPPFSMAKDVNDYLSEGNLKDGVTDYSKRIESKTSNELVFSLAALEFLSSIETLIQSFYKYGLDSRTGQRANLPFLHLPIPKNPNPESISYNDFRDILSRFYIDIKNTNKILEKINNSKFIVPIDIGHIRLDTNGNRKIEVDEYFYKIYVTFNREARKEFKNDNPFTINFDEGDAYWLKGYTHLLLAITDILLAYDGNKVFEYTAHVFFPEAETKLASAFKKQGVAHYSIWADMIAGIHVMNMDVKDPDRLKSAHGHLLSVIDSSRKSWQLIETETDNSKEWIPNGKQESVNGSQITQDMIVGWSEFLGEFEQILLGDNLIPHWRFEGDRGINLEKVFFEPRAFDLILWVQGASAIYYLEKGNVSSTEIWRRMSRLFQGDFIGFAIWIN